VQRTKHLTDLHLSGWRDLRLLLEEQYTEVEQRRADVAVGLFVKAGGEIDASNLCAKRRREGCDTERVTHCTTA